jgi:hypothetical protein
VELVIQDDKAGQIDPLEGSPELKAKLNGSLESTKRPHDVDG